MTDRETIVQRSRFLRAGLPVRQLVICVSLVTLCVGCSKDHHEQPPSKASPHQRRTLELFVGSASKPPTEEVVAAFQEKTGANLEVHFGSSGKMLAEMKLSGRGDVYFPGSSDYMELAKEEGLIDSDSERRVVYLLPAINVRKGNPLGVKSVSDLARKGLRVGIGRPDTVCVGLYAIELLESLDLTVRIKPNIVTHAESCAKTAQLLSLGTVDAVLGWDVFAHWDPKHIETIYLPPKDVPRIGYIPIAIATSTSNKPLAQEFVNFVISDDGLAFYRKWGYLTKLEEARKHTTPATPVGGQWPLPDAWR